MVRRHSQSTAGAVSGCYGEEPHPEVPSPDLLALSSLISPKPVLSSYCCSSVYTNLLLSISASLPPAPQKARKILASSPKVSSRSHAWRELREGGTGGALLGLGPSPPLLGPPSQSRVGRSAPPGEMLRGVVPVLLTLFFPLLKPISHLNYRVILHFQIRSYCFSVSNPALLPVAPRKSPESSPGSALRELARPPHATYPSSYRLPPWSVLAPSKPTPTLFVLLPP